MGRPLFHEGVGVCSHVQSEKTMAQWGALVDLSASIGPCRQVGIASPVRRCGGDDVGCEVLAFRSYCSTEILCTCSADTCSSSDGFKVQGRAGE